MSPIRPALGFVHARTPKPTYVREVRCPYCSHSFEASQKAISLRCPRCTNPLKIEDKIVRKEVKGQVATVGQVRITTASVLSGDIVCSDFLNAGRFDGSALVHGPIDLQPGSLTTGTISGRSLRALLGATLRAKLNIGPTHGEGLHRVAAVKGPGLISS